jgi:hypothetical protein
MTHQELPSSIDDGYLQAHLLGHLRRLGFKNLKGAKVFAFLKAF